MPATPAAAAPLLWRDPKRFLWPLALYLPLQYVSLLCACAWWASGELSLAGSLGLALTVGVVGGIAINTAHELGHKASRGHHVAVATPEDPSSARRGESFWAFLPRTVLGSAGSAWKIDRRDALASWALGAALFAALIALFGARIAPWLKRADGRYQALSHFEEAPQLPWGHLAMILLAYVPPLWRRVMDPRLPAAR